LIHLLFLSLFVSAEDEQKEQRDATASPYTESPYETGDSNVDPNYSLYGDPYSNSSDSNSSSLHEVKVSALNEPQNLDLIAERENRNQRAEKEREPFNQNGKEIKSNCYEIHRTHTHTHRNFKRSTEVPERKMRPLVGPLVERNIFLSSPNRKHLIFQTIWWSAVAIIKSSEKK